MDREEYPPLRLPQDRSGLIERACESEDGCISAGGFFAFASEKMWANLGMVLSNKDILGRGKFLVIDTDHDDVGFVLTLTPIGDDLSYDAKKIVLVYNNPMGFNSRESLKYPNLSRFTLHEKMIRKTALTADSFSLVPKEGLGEFSTEPCTHTDRLSPTNPLRDFPFWNAPGGRNLAVIHSLEWSLVHLKHCDDELPCSENAESILLLERLIFLQQERRRKRIEQGVLGKPIGHVS